MKLLICVLGVLCASAAAAAPMTPEQRRFLEHAGELVGHHESIGAALSQCPTALPQLRGPAATRARQLSAANDSIVAMARIKILALSEALDGPSGIAEAKSLLNKARTDAVTHVQQELSIPPQGRAFCEGIILGDQQRLIISRRYPDHYEGVVNFRIGYPWRPDGCEYEATFPIRPKLEQVTSGRNSAPRAITPEPTEYSIDLPVISVSCWPTAGGDVQRTIEALHTAGADTLAAYGVHAIQSRSGTSPLGSTITFVGQKEVSGIGFTIEKIILMGRRSYMETTFTELSETFPSIFERQFKEWITRE